MIIDESHVTIPQVRAMYNGDRARKETLIKYGFRLPSAADNRPLKFEEFEDRLNQVIFTSATPSDYEKEHSTVVAEQVIRPTGLLDPKITIKPTENQIDDLIGEINKRNEQGFRTLVTTLTKRMAEALTDYLTGVGIKVRYMHSDLSTIERAEIIKDLRMGVFDVLVGINFLREGLDIPEVALVAILDADKEGFLRSEMSLIQTIGRAARNSEGQVIMYADTVTKSMKKAIDETDRRRGIQQKFNEEHGIIPVSYTHLDVYKRQSYNIVSKLQALVDISEVKSVTVEYNGAEHTIDITHNDSDMTFVLDGQKVDTKTTQAIYKSIVSLAVDGVYKDETLGDTVMKIKYKGIKSSSDTEVEFKSIDDLYCALIRNGKTEFTIKKSKLNEFMDLFNIYVENPEKQGD